MDTFIAGNIIWPDGWTKLHVYFVPNPQEIKPLLDAYRDVIEQFEFISPVPEEWLHATVQMIDGRPAHDILPSQLADLQACLKQQINDLPTFTLTAGGALASRSGVVLDLTPDREFAEIIHRSRNVIRDVLGEDGIKYSGGRPHMTLGYAKGHGDSGVVQSRLRNATDMRVTLTVAEVRLVDVIQDPMLHQYRWEEVARLPLSPAPDRS